MTFVCIQSHNEAFLIFILESFYPSFVFDRADLERLIHRNFLGMLAPLPFDLYNVYV